MKTIPCCTASVGTGFLARFHSLLLILFVASGANAQGVIEIHPLCVDTGCFSGDSPGFPVTINAPGSYRLTGDLDLRNETSPASTDAIVISAPDVRLDLAGFRIIGEVTCTGTPVTDCLPDAGFGSGVEVTTGSHGVWIGNGQIVGVGGRGINCFGDSRCHIEDVTVRENGAGGVFAGTGVEADYSRVERVRAIRNGLFGINTRGIVIDSHAFGNATDGIFNTDGLVERSQLRANGDDGVFCNRCTLRYNVSIGNQGYGVRFEGGVNPGAESLTGGNRLRGNTMPGMLGSPTRFAPDICDGALC